MKGLRVLALMAIASTSAYALVQGVNVEPVKASWSGKVRREAGVGQGFVACFDSIEAVHLFIGLSEGEAEYVVNIGEPGSAPMMTSSPVAAVKAHCWLEFEDWQTEARFTKGKTYVATFTRTSGLDLVSCCLTIG